MSSQPPFTQADPSRPLSTATRRALLGMGFAFLGGAIVGGSCGYSFASTAETGGPGSTGDPEQDRLQALARHGSDAELMAVSRPFVVALVRTYPEDAVLWHGVDRIAQILVADDQAPERGVMARWLVQVIECAETEAADSCRKHTSSLEGIP